ncbi:MAG: crotonase/enoyl-CoA hydratase family protein [Actinomycetota bacterium]
MAYEEIIYDVSDRIATITLNRPDRLNAFTTTMARELIDAFGQADNDDDVRVVIVTGSGRGFCAGADLGAGGATFDNRVRGGAQSIQEHRDGGGVVTLRIYDMSKPVIAAINGPAVGVGITMTLPMDVRLAVPDAKIGFVFARRGIVPEACSSWFLPRIVGIGRATEWVYSGRVFPATEAYEAGLIQHICAPDVLLERAHEIAREIVDNTSAVSVALSRHLLWRGLGLDHPMEAHKVDSKAIYAMGRSADAAEGVTAFLEKRDAKFPMTVPKDLPDFFPWWEERRFSDPSP